MENRPKKRGAKRKPIREVLRFSVSIPKYILDEKGRETICEEIKNNMDMFVQKIKNKSNEYKEEK